MKKARIYLAILIATAIVIFSCSGPAEALIDESISQEFTLNDTIVKHEIIVEVIETTEEAVQEIAMEEDPVKVAASSEELIEKNVLLEPVIEELTEESNVEGIEVEEVIEEEDVTEVNNDNTIQFNESADKFENYTIELTVNKEIKENNICMLKIWIGSSEIEHVFSDDVVAAQTDIPSDIGEYAVVTPFAPDFEVDPVVSKCTRIHSSGSEFLFSLKPKTTGKLTISATVELYTEGSCTGPSVPKTSRKLSVIVKVNGKDDLICKLKELGNIVWDNFIVFFGAFISIIFGLILYKFRKQIKKTTGFDETE